MLLGVIDDNRSLRIVISIALGVIVLTLPLHLIDLDEHAAVPRLMRELEPAQDREGRPLIEALILRRGNRLYLRSHFDNSVPRLVQIEAQATILRANQPVVSGAAPLIWLGETGPARHWSVEIPLQGGSSRQIGLLPNDRLELELRFAGKPMLLLGGRIQRPGLGLAEARWWRPATVTP